MRHVHIVQARKEPGGGLHQIQGVCKSEEVEDEDLGGSKLWEKSIVQYLVKSAF